TSHRKSPFMRCEKSRAAGPSQHPECRDKRRLQSSPQLRSPRRETFNGFPLTPAPLPQGERGEAGGGMGLPDARFVALLNLDPMREIDVSSEIDVSPGPASFPATAGAPRPILWGAVILMWLLVFVPGLFAPTLLDDADSTHAEAAREMLTSGDYVTLHVNGVRYLEKAPLPYWLAALSYRAFGVSEFSTRL